MSSKPSNFGKVLLTQSRVNKRARKRGGSGVGGIAPNGSNDGEANSSSSGRARRRINQTMHMKENVPSLHEFMHRQTVISQYRQFFRAINTVGDKDSSTSMKNEVRTAFKSLLHEEDKFSIKIALKEVNIEYSHLFYLQRTSVISNFHNNTFITIFFVNFHYEKG